MWHIPSCSGSRVQLVLSPTSMPRARRPPRPSSRRKTYADYANCSPPDIDRWPSQRRTTGTPSPHRCRPCRHGRLREKPLWGPPRGPALVQAPGKAPSSRSEASRFPLPSSQARVRAQRRNASFAIRAILVGDQVADGKPPRNHCRARLDFWLGPPVGRIHPAPLPSRIRWFYDYSDGKLTDWAPPQTTRQWGNGTSERGGQDRAIRSAFHRRPL